MSRDAQFTHAHMTRFDWPMPAAREAVWAVLTDTTRLPGWYGEGVIEGRVGGKVELLSGHIKGVVTQWKPHKKLTYTWNVFMSGQAESDYPESYLTLELSDSRLTLTHLPVLDAFLKLNAAGWHTFLDMVDAASRNQPIQPREAYMQRNAERYGVDLSKRPS